MHKSLMIAQAVTAICLSACVPPPPQQLAPIALLTTKTPEQVVQAAALEFANDGFQITASDAPSGIMSATRDRPIREHGADVTCIYGPKTLGAALRAVAFTVNVSAVRTDSTGTAVRIVSNLRTHNNGQQGALSVPDNSTDCASSGAIERRIAEAVK
jgi:hypothetical protein